jgi:hypothetical protein
MSTVYVENSNNKSSLEDIMYCNDVTLGFSSKTFGASNLFRFSRTYQFLAQVIMELKIVQDGIILSDYFAYSAIDQIRWTVGGTELLSINGKQALNLVLEQCETQAKKEALLRNAGRRQYTTTGVGGQDLQTNTAIVNASDDLHFYACIPCPWSSLSKMNAVKPFPLHMLSEPIELQIVFKQGAEFCTDITAFSEANLHFRYGKLGSPEQLKKEIYRWPFNSHFSHEFTLASGATSIDLTGFRKGEVSQLLFHYVPNNSAVTKVDNDGVPAKRFFDGIEVNNLALTFNGQKIWSAPNKEQRMWSLIDGIDSGGYHNKMRIAIVNSQDNVPVMGGEATGTTIVEGIASKGTGVDGVATGVANENLNGRFVYYRIPIAEILAEYQRQGHYLGADFTKQSIQLTFDAPKSRVAAVTAVPVNVPTKLYMTYSYRALYQTDGESALLVF